MRIARRLRSGMTSINAALAFAGMPSLPFGGVGDSGIGRIHGDDGLREFTRPKAITQAPDEVGAAGDVVRAHAEAGRADQEGRQAGARPAQVGLVHGARRRRGAPYSVAPMFTDYVVPRRMGSEPRMRARTLVAAIAVVALAAAGIVAGTMVYLYGNPWGCGPLRATGWIDTALSTRSGAAATFSGPKLYNTGRRPIIIDRIEPQSRTEIDDAEFTVAPFPRLHPRRRAASVRFRRPATTLLAPSPERCCRGSTGRLRRNRGHPADVTGLGAGGIDRLVVDYHVGPVHVETWASAAVNASTSRSRCATRRTRAAETVSSIGGRSPCSTGSLRSGMTSVDATLAVAGMPSLPFGGVGDSGIGRITATTGCASHPAQGDHRTSSGAVCPLAAGPRRRHRRRCRSCGGTLGDCRSRQRSPSAGVCSYYRCAYRRCVSHVGRVDRGNISKPSPQDCRPDRQSGADQPVSPPVTVTDRSAAAVSAATGQLAGCLPNLLPTFRTRC